MSRSRIIVEELAKIDTDLEKLYSRQRDLNKELRNIEEEKIQLEIERWDITPGATFILFTKDNDSTCSTCFGYEVEALTDTKFIKAIETSFTFTLDDTYLNVRKVNCHCSTLRTWREQCDVYKIDNELYRRLQFRWLRLDTDFASLQDMKTQVSESSHQVD